MNPVSQETYQEWKAGTTSLLCDDCVEKHVHKQRDLSQTDEGLSCPHCGKTWPIESQGEVNA